MNPQEIDFRGLAKELCSLAEALSEHGDFSEYCYRVYRASDALILAAAMQEQLAAKEKELTEIERQVALVAGENYKLKQQLAAIDKLRKDGAKMVGPRQDSAVMHKGYEVHKNDKIQCYECFEIFYAMHSAAPDLLEPIRGKA